MLDSRSDLERGRLTPKKLTNSVVAFAGQSRREMCYDFDTAFLKNLLPPGTNTQNEFFIACVLLSSDSSLFAVADIDGVALGSRGKAAQHRFHYGRRLGLHGLSLLWQRLL